MGGRREINTHTDTHRHKGMGGGGGDRDRETTLNCALQEAHEYNLQLLYG